jgi:hypothetical protein
MRGGIPLTQLANFSKSAPMDPLLEFGLIVCGLGIAIGGLSSRGIGLALLALGLGAVAVPAFEYMSDKEKSEEIIPSTPTRPNYSSETRAKLDPSITPEHLVQFVRDRTDAQARILTIMYIGKFMDIRGVVGNVRLVEFSSGVRVSLYRTAPDGVEAYLQFDSRWAEKLKAVLIGDEIAATCILTDITREDVVLAECEIERITRPPQPDASPEAPRPASPPAQTQRIFVPSSVTPDYLVVRCRRKIPSGQEPSAATMRLLDPERGTNCRRRTTRKSVRPAYDGPRKEAC